MHHTKVRHLGAIKVLSIQGYPCRGVPHSRKCGAFSLLASQMAPDKYYSDQQIFVQRSQEAVLFLDRVWIYHGKLSRDKATTTHRSGTFTQPC